MSSKIMRNNFERTVFPFKKKNYCIKSFPFIIQNKKIQKTLSSKQSKHKYQYAKISKEAKRTLID